MPERRVFQVRISSWMEVERGVCLPVAEAGVCCRRVYTPRAPMTTGVILRRTPRRRRQRLMDVCLNRGWMSVRASVNALT